VGIDDRHEVLSAEWLSDFFGPQVTEPVRLHVQAKRYLCAVDPAYQAGLSAASNLSLVLQGGPMDAEEQARFCAQPHAADAVALRRWDDAAKDPHCAVPPLDSWRPLLASLLRISAQP
jgi:gamma-butyrobetaine dioxygenase